ncbi:exocyst complex subunit sec15-like domain-containing protein [Trichoderma breve]|uniref:Exocyst complex component SEC15 n=1 Tax=Trichoderma breve TaxID=2034170 RepID=A0A9W9E5J5_9HYPO|nr:exocyst complex subunit sec15-like domain-containing protein [Trichoderma breve]KAJ4855471.1 exocyst complex subunit sec15-like domain-containing protein [Trichoderma breve]
MPRRHGALDDYTSAVPQIILSTSDSDYLDHLIPVLKDATNSRRTPALLQSLSRYSEDREADIERIGLTKHEEFLDSVHRLQEVREGTVTLTTEILKLNQSIQASTEKLADQKGALVNTKAVRQNIADAADALRESLTVLHAVNHSHELVRRKKYYSALKSLEDLQNEHLVPILQNRYATQHRLADAIQKSLPASRRAISEAVMSDLNTWLFRIRETSQFLGEVAFYHTEMRRNRQRARIENEKFLENFKLNSSIELISDENEEFDVLDNEELQVDFTPLFEALHIHDALGHSDRFRSEYASTRRQQKDLLVPTSIDLLAEDGSSLSSLLEGIAGFAIIEKATMQRVPYLRSVVDVEELWDSMCTAAIALTTKALTNIDNAEVLLKIKSVIALFIQTMEGWGYSVSTLDNFLLQLFDKYAQLLKRRFSEDFQEIVSTDDYMPMAINSLSDYEKVINVSWFTPDRPTEELTFPCVLPFSQMYPLCCIDIRNFLNQFYFFLDDHFQHSDIIDETLRKSLDELLSEKILINLEHFEIACRELEQLLIRARSSTSAGGPLRLNATEEFRNNKKTAEKRIFELVNSKIDDLVDTAEYDWLASGVPTEPSNYMQTLTRYLSNIMNSTLLGLPREIKELIYFDALSHAAEKILLSKALPLSPEVRHINGHGVFALAQDVNYLTEFVGSLENGQMLRENLDELQQTVNLMQSDNHEEFYDISIRNKKYGRVDVLNGPILLEKLTPTAQPSGRAAPLSNLSRFAIMK